MKCFIAGCVGGAVGGLMAGLTGVGASAYGITGLFGYLITTDYTVQYTMVVAASVITAFVISWVLYREEQIPAAESIEQKSETENSSAQAEFRCEKNTVYSPLKGNAIPLTEVKDSTFAGEILGKGMAVIPSEGTVYLSLIHI